MPHFSTIKKFMSENQGNVAIAFSLALIPIMLSVGSAIDYSRQSNLHNKVSFAADAALLAATSAAMENADLGDKKAVLAELNAVFEPFLLANLDPALDYQYNGFSINYDPTSNDISVDIDIDYKTSVLGIAGRKNWKADVHAATNMQMKAGGAFSMYLVLDRSGSMAWDSGQVSCKNNGKGKGYKKSKYKGKKKGCQKPVSKMDALKSAVVKMVSELKAADADNQFIRMGAVSYSSYTWTAQQLSWKLDSTSNYVQSMSAYGGTDSSGAVKVAYDKLTHSQELSQHKAKNGQVPDLVMVFMTDGDNNYSYADTSTLSTCKKAKAQGIKIYTVAFQAPSKGQKLLRSCASDSSHYFEPENTEELIDAFSKIGAGAGEKLVLSK